MKSVSVGFLVEGGILELCLVVGIIGIVLGHLQTAKHTADKAITGPQYHPGFFRLGTAPFAESLKDPETFLIS